MIELLDIKRNTVDFFKPLSDFDYQRLLISFLHAYTECAQRLGGNAPHYAYLQLSRMQTTNDFSEIMGELNLHGHFTLNMVRFDNVPNELLFSYYAPNSKPIRCDTYQITVARPKTEDKGVIADVLSRAYDKTSRLNGPFSIPDIFAKYLQPKPVTEPARPLTADELSLHKAIRLMGKHQIEGLLQPLPR